MTYELDTTRSAPTTIPNFDEMNRKELNDWYETVVGYRPDEDNGNPLPIKDLREFCASFQVELDRLALQDARAAASSAAAQGRIDGPYRVGEWVRLTRDLDRRTTHGIMKFASGTKAKIIEVDGDASARDFRGMDGFIVETLSGNTIAWEADADEGTRFEDDTELLSSDEIPSDLSADEIQRQSDGDEVGYEGLPARIQQLLGDIEGAAIALTKATHFADLNRANDALFAARGAFTSYVIDALREWDPREQDDDEPTCEGCGQEVADVCFPCYVIFDDDRREEVMYGPDCFEKGNADIRMGEPDGKRAIVRLDWQWFKLHTMSRYYRVIVSGLTLKLQGADRLVLDDLSVHVDTDTIYDVRRWPFGQITLDRLNRQLGTSFTLGDFSND